MPSKRGSPSLARKIGARIRAIRMERGATQESIAWACDISKAHLWRIEEGENLPSIPVLFSLAKELDVRAIDLLNIDTRDPRSLMLKAARHKDAGAVRAAMQRLGLHTK